MRIAMSGPPRGDAARPYTLIPKGNQLITKSPLASAMPRPLSVANITVPFLQSPPLKATAGQSQCLVGRERGLPPGACGRLSSRGDQGDRRKPSNQSTLRTGRFGAGSRAAILCRCADEVATVCRPDRSCPAGATFRAVQGRGVSGGCAKALASLRQIL